MKCELWLTFSMFLLCHCLSSPGGPGLVLPSGDQDWSSGGMGGPMVLPPSAQDSSWKMWYYGCAADGRNTTKVLLCPGGIPFGGVGIAISADGLHWKPSPRNPVFSPSDDSSAFDAGRVAVGSIVQWQGQLSMFYFASKSRQSLGAPSIGLAVSSDGGFTWKRVNGTAGGGAVLRSESAVEGALDVTQPHVLVLASGSLRMYYVGLKIGATGMHFALWQADSADGVEWGNKQKLQIPSVGLGPGSFGVLALSAHRLLMFAGWELPGQQDAIGVLQGESNSTEMQLHPEARGRQALQPSGTPGAWDEYAVGCPHPLVHKGILYVYFNGFEKPAASGKALASIGLAMGSNSSDYFGLKRVELSGLITV